MTDRLKSRPQLTRFPDIDAFLWDCFETMEAKGHDYREGNDDDALHNFRTMGEDLDLPMEKIWFVYFSKHLKALKTYIKEGGQRESEPIEGRIKDMLVYLLLFYKMVQENKKFSVEPAFREAVKLKLDKDDAPG